MINNNSKRESIKLKKDTQKSRIKEAKKLLKDRGIPSKSFIHFDEDTLGEGILGVGILKARGDIFSSYNNEENDENNLEESIPLYDIFFIKKKNSSIRGDNNGQYHFLIIKTINKITIEECSNLSGIKNTNILPITEDQLKNDYFYHPIYINEVYNKLKIYYGEIPCLIQTDPVTLGNLPIGFPAFNYNKSSIITKSPLPPSAPYTFFGAKGYSVDEEEIIISGSGILNFVDKSPQFPIQIAPTEWEWKIGENIIGNTKDVIYDASALPIGSYDVKLISSNKYGSREYTRKNYVISARELYFNEMYNDIALLGFSLKGLKSKYSEVVEIRIWQGGLEGSPFEDTVNIKANEIESGEILSIVGPGNSATVVRFIQQFDNEIINVDLRSVENGSDYSFEPIIVDGGDIIRDTNGNPSVLFDGTKRMECNIFTGSGDKIINSPYTSVFSLSVLGDNNNQVITVDGNGNNLLGTDALNKKIKYNNQKTAVDYLDNSPIILYIINSSINNSVVRTKSIEDNQLIPLNVGLESFIIGDVSTGAPFKGYLNELIIFNGDMNKDINKEDMDILVERMNKRYL